MPVDSNSVANQALSYIGDNSPPISGQAPTFDSSPAGKACATFYDAVVQTVGQQYNWDFARHGVALTPTGNTPPLGWAFEYSFPGTIDVWQVLDPANTDPNNPLPVNWTVGNTLVSGVQTKVIACNTANAIAIFNNNPGPSLWTPLFREAVVRLLANVLAAAIAGRPDTAQAYLEGSAAFETIAESRPD